MKVSLSRSVVNVPLSVLPSVYLVLCIVTAFVASRSPEIAWARMMPVTPLSYIPLWVLRNSFVVIFVFAILGTAWWYCIGRMAWESTRHTISRVSSALAALLCGYVAVSGYRALMEFMQSERLGGSLDGAAMIQYRLDALLCAGALVTAAFSLAAVFSKRKRPDATDKASSTTT